MQKRGIKISIWLMVFFILLIILSVRVSGIPPLPYARDTIYPQTGNLGIANNFKVGMTSSPH